jgi:hypothetical protein
MYTSPNKETKLCIPSVTNLVNVSKPYKTNILHKFICIRKKYNYKRQKGLNGHLSITKILYTGLAPALKAVLLPWDHEIYNLVKGYMFFLNVLLSIWHH